MKKKLFLIVFTIFSILPLIIFVSSEKLNKELIQVNLKLDFYSSPNKIDLILLANNLQINPVGISKYIYKGFINEFIEKNKSFYDIKSKSETEFHHIIRFYSDNIEKDLDRLNKRIDMSIKENSNIILKLFYDRLVSGIPPNSKDIMMNKDSELHLLYKDIKEIDELIKNKIFFDNFLIIEIKNFKSLSFLLSYLITIIYLFILFIIYKRN